MVKEIQFYTKKELMVNMSIIEIIAKLNFDESIIIDTDLQSHALVFTACKKSPYAGHTRYSSIKMDKFEFESIKPEYQEVYVTNTFEALLDKVRSGSGKTEG